MRRRKYIEAVAGIAGIGSISVTTAARETGNGRGPLDEVPPEDQGTGRGPPERLDESDREKITELLETYVADGAFPGAAAAVVDDKGVLYHEAVGNAQTVPVTRELTEETVFDLASVTKAVATGTSVLQLIDRGEIGLEDAISEYYSDVPDEKREITISQLLTHTSGLPAWAALWNEVDHPDQVIDYILRDTSLHFEPGTEVTYSGLGFILLGDLVEKVTGSPLDEYTAENIFEPLEMDSTAFNPLENLPEDREYAATERSAYYDNEVVVGEVHDENAAYLGGVSGNAGLFSTIDDLSTFARAILNGGKGKKREPGKPARILSNRTVDVMAEDWTSELDGARGLGWDRREIFGTDENGESFDPDAFGHMGFTGTSIWFSPRLNLGVIALTNRVHPSRESYGIYDFRPEFHNLIASLVTSQA